MRLFLFTVILSPVGVRTHTHTQMLCSTFWLQSRQNIFGNITLDVRHVSLWWISEGWKIISASSC